MTELARTRPESFFSDRFNITSGLMDRVLGGNLIGKVDDADIYLEYRINEELVLEEGTVKKASRHVSQGAGVRAQAGTRTGYAHTDEISIQNLDEAARQARAIADRSGGSGALALPTRGRPHDLYTLAEPPIVTDLALKLGAVDAPAGAMTVVLGPGWPGILLHEAIGHGLEGDFNRKGTSAFAGRMGEQVAAPECTVVDDGTLAARRGS